MRADPAPRPGPPENDVAVRLGACPARSPIPSRRRNNLPAERALPPPAGSAPKQHHASQVALPPATAARGSAPKAPPAVFLHSCPYLLHVVRFQSERVVVFRDHSPHRQH